LEAGGAEPGSGQSGQPTEKPSGQPSSQLSEQPARSGAGVGIKWTANRETIWTAKQPAFGTACNGQAESERFPLCDIGLRQRRARVRELALLDVRLSSLRICQLVELFFFSNSKSVGSFIFFLQ